MAHLYGVKPWEVGQLRSSELQALLNEANWILYLRDRATLRYHWFKTPQENRQLLASVSILSDDGTQTDANEPPDETTKRALEAFYAPYDLPEFKRPRPSERALRELQDAIQAGELPAWAFLLVTKEELP